MAEWAALRHSATLLAWVRQHHEQTNWKDTSFRSERRLWRYPQNYREDVKSRSYPDCSRLERNDPIDSSRSGY